MIKTKNGKTELKGNIITLKCDISTIIKAAREAFFQNMSQEEADECVRDAIRKGFMTKEELKNEAKALEDKIQTELKELVNAIFSPIKAGGDLDEN